MTRSQVGKPLKLLASASAFAVLAMAPQAASASLIFDSTIDVTAQGFGNNPRL
jgi:DNA-binding IclR family transcriptional regulator